MAIDKFLRTEQKYILSKEQYNLLLNNILKYLKKDKYFEERIYNIYFDTLNNDLIINSLNKPIYKEKVRLRSYGVSKDSDIVYLELKKKFNGVVFKRRFALPLSSAMLYINSGKMPDTSNQIMREIDYTFKTYHLLPKVSIVYDRKSYISGDDSDFRLTFDYNVKSSTKNFKLQDLNNEKDFIDGKYLMEIKTTKAIPFWLLKSLTELRIYPHTFSKYGAIYTKLKESVINV